MGLAARLFAPPPDAPTIAPAADPAARRAYRYWRIRQLYTTFIGYAVFYFVRKNISVALPLMEERLGVSKAQLGVFLTLHDVLYGFSKFANGLVADRANPRVLMVVGLVGSAALNGAVGLSSSALVLGTLWAANGWFQGLGFPPVARILSHWFAPKERGLMWGIWNTSHQVGAAAILVLAGYLGRWDWRACFFVPAAIAGATGLFLALRLRDTPGSLGLPPVEEYTGEYIGAYSGDAPESAAPARDAAAFRRLLVRRVFKNPYVWLAAGGNFFVYVVRYGVMNWAPSYLHQHKGIRLDHAGWMLAGFEVAGLVGSLVAGWLTDRFFQCRRAPVCVLYMLATALALLLFWRSPAGPMADAALLAAIGFFVYGPQFLVGVLVADQATKEAAATAVGVTGFFGYISGVVSGWGLGFVLDRHGWSGGFLVLVVCALLAAAPFAFAWNAAPARAAD